MINWYNASWLVILWAVPVVAVVLWGALRWRRRSAERFAEAPMLTRLAPRTDAVRSAVRIVLLSVALVCLIVALARPRYGTYLQDIRTSGADVCVVLDVSRSMLAEDVKPNRLERARLDILDLADRLEGDRMGLIIFAGTPLMKVPLTTDLAFFRAALDDVDETAVSRGGSRLGDAILKALDSMESRFDRQQVIVLISDGEDQDSLPEQAARAAAERDVKIIAVGLGDATDGARIPMRDETGNLAYLQHNGEEVWSVLREDVLRKLAGLTGGAYVPAPVYDLGEIYDNHLSSLTRAEADIQKRRRYRERFQLFAALALLCLLAEGMTSTFRADPKPVASQT